MNEISFSSVFYIPGRQEFLAVRESDATGTTKKKFAFALHDLLLCYALPCPCVEEKKGELLVTMRIFPPYLISLCFSHLSEVRTIIVRLHVYCHDYLL